jgi:hypothetical protein
VNQALIALEAARKVVQGQQVSLKVLDKHRDQWEKNTKRIRERDEQDEIDGPLSVKYKHFG